MNSYLTLRKANKMRLAMVSETSQKQIRDMVHYFCLSGTSTVRIFPFGRILTISYVCKLLVFCQVYTSIMAVLRWVW